jgi:hypothetical protein
MGPQTEDKRMREMDTSAPEINRKRVKLDDETESTSKMDSKELASAFALASLASFSPGSKYGKPTQTSNVQQLEEAGLISAGFETRSPKSEPIPISPEVRSPVRPIKRVHFASNVKEQQTHSPAPRFSFQPTGSPQSFPVRMHPPGFRGFPLRQQHPQWMHTRMPHQRLVQPQLALSDHHWICDFCNAAAFNTYEEACIHEEACKLQCAPTGAEIPRPPLMFHGFPGGGSTGIELEGECNSFEPQNVPVRSSTSSEWFSGSISLAIPESDSEWLSEINCFIRKFCIEAFSATEEDVASTSKRGRITLHQVGIRCRHCKHRPLKERAVAAVSYPTSVAGIYESVKRWQRVHLEHCEDIPHEVSSKMTELQSTNVWIPTTRQYWTDSARALGMVDTEGGIRFSCDPRYLREVNMPEALEPATEPSEVGKHDGKILADGDYIVFPDDMRIVPPYVYFLMRQVESCHFSEVDRFVARSKGPVGYPGFQCRHCSGHAGLGKYFPVSAKTLSTNSTSQNIHAHLLKCRKCPDHIKQKLVALKVEKSRSPRLEPGWRKIFFDKVWVRLHG